MAGSRKLKREGATFGVFAPAPSAFLKHRVGRVDSLRRRRRKNILLHRSVRLEPPSEHPLGPH